jgi:thiamine pyrophosphokinase
MSSHHIVRENQEPALVVESVTDLDKEYVGQLLEWCPTVFTNDYTIDFFLADDIKVDVVVTNQCNNLYVQEQIKKIPLQRGFIADALQYLVVNNYKAVNIICDEIPDEVFSYCNQINIVLFIGGKRYVFVEREYKKWKQKGEKIFVREDRLKSLVGIQKVSINTFITEQDGFIYLAFNTPEFVWIGEEI